MINMRYAELKLNDIANGDGIGVSFFVQGCHKHCFNCFNPETWDFNGGKEFTQETLDAIVNGLRTNGIKRHLSILGGEPLCPENTFLTYLVIKTVKEKLPDTKVYVWSGYYYNELLKSTDPRVKNILELTDVLVDGPYIDELKQLNLPLRGSLNQTIRYLKEEK